MAFEEIKEGFSEAETSTRSYLENAAEFYKLKGFKFLMKGIISLSKVLMIGSAVFLALLFLSLAASFGIGQVLDNTFYGFLCVGSFYLIIGIILYFLRHKLDKPFLRKFSEFYFDEL